MKYYEEKELLRIVFLNRVFEKLTFKGKKVCDIHKNI